MSKLCIWKKEKNDRILANRGIETGMDYIGKWKKNHGVGTNCVFGKRRKMTGL